MSALILPPNCRFRRISIRTPCRSPGSRLCDEKDIRDGGARVVNFTKNVKHYIELLFNTKNMLWLCTVMFKQLLCSCCCDVMKSKVTILNDLFLVCDGYLGQPKALLDLAN